MSRLGGKKAGKKRGFLVLSRGKKEKKKAWFLCLFFLFTPFHFRLLFRKQPEDIMGG
jgi:hypothetical protein